MRRVAIDQCRGGEHSNGTNRLTLARGRRTGRRGVAVLHHTAASEFFSSRGGNERAYAAEPPAWHAAVDCLVLSRAHEVGLMPDSDIAPALAHTLIERD